MNEAQARLAVVGDVHGDAERLARTLDALLTDVATHIVFTGDYVNRGPHSWHVLELLLAARDRHSAGITLIRGNHEDALLKFLNGGYLSDFAAHGGLATIKSYLPVVRTGAVEEFKEKFPQEHRSLLEEMPSHYENDSLLISHTGFDPADPSARTPETLYESSHPELFSYSGPWPRPLTVCGHYIQLDKQPYDSEHLICLDTGCGTVPGSPLTVLDLPERNFRQF